MEAQQPNGLAELARSSLAGADLPSLMRQAVALVAHRLAVAYSAIWELLPDHRALVLQAGVGWTGDAVGHATASVGTFLANETVSDATSIIVADWPSETRFNQPPLLRQHGVMCSLYAVVHGPICPFGILSVDSPVCRTFSGEEIEFLRMVANLMALAIERIRASQTLDQRVEERTREIEQQLVAAAQKQAVLEERQRFARDLHDSVTQALYGITLHAQAAWRLLASGEVGVAAESLHALQDTAQEALDEMRLLIFELRPPILEQVGLVAALQARLNTVEGRANLQTRLIADGVGGLPSLVEQALYRIAQEALNNALKYAHAKHIIVQLQQAQSRVALEVIDDGVGFDPALARKNGGLGLQGIAERVAQLEGQLTVQSASGAGTRLRVELAL